uniref:Flavoprotein, HI0933 family n=1 Tax=Desulfovibrio sp. U5L TaxID=596152 RepID=I2Q5D0_9BACT
MHTDVIILGAGASGLCCATACARRGRAVVVLDHGGKAARKVLASGGGRANCTNTDLGPADYRCANPHFVKSALARFTPWDFLEWANGGGVATREEDGGKVFCRDGAVSLARFLVAEAETAGARIVTGSTLAAARKEGEAFVVDTEAGPVRSKALVLALGGKSWPGLGATDFGYRLARSFGLGLTELRPGLTPFLAGADLAEFCRELAGVSLPVAISGPASVSGDLLFTHKGISGPAVFDASLFWRPGQTLAVDFLPGFDLDAALAEAGKLELKNALARHLPKRLAAALCARLGLSGTVANLSKRDRQALAGLLGAFPFTPAKAEGFAKAEVTIGGVDTAAISSKTLEAASVPGLYVIGELLDVTGRLGGFNLHWAFASGFAAGNAA